MSDVVKTWKYKQDLHSPALVILYYIWNRTNLFSYLIGTRMFSSKQRGIERDIIQHFGNPNLRYSDQKQI